MKKSAASAWKYFLRPLLMILLGSASAYFMISAMPTWHAQAMANTGYFAVNAPIPTSIALWVGIAVAILGVQFAVVVFLRKLFDA